MLVSCPVKGARSGCGAARKSTISEICRFHGRDFIGTGAGFASSKRGGLLFGSAMKDRLNPR